MSKTSVFMIVSFITLILFVWSLVIPFSDAYEKWHELSREEQVRRAIIYSIVNLESGREVVVHPDYGFEIPLSLALMSGQNG